MTHETRLPLGDPMAFDPKAPYRVLLDNLTLDAAMMTAARQHCEGDAVQGAWVCEIDMVKFLVTACFRFERLWEAQAFVAAIPGSYRVNDHPNVAAEFQKIMDEVCDSTNPDQALRKKENTRKLLAFALTTGRISSGQASS